VDTSQDADEKQESITCIGCKEHILKFD